VNREPVPRCQTFNARLVRFAGWGFVADIDAAIAHDCDLLLKVFYNAPPHGKVACDCAGAPMLLWF
jgi:hypothetical protein